MLRSIELKLGPFLRNGLIRSRTLLSRTCAVEHRITSETVKLFGVGLPLGRPAVGSAKAGSAGRRGYHVRSVTARRRAPALHLNKTGATLPRSKCMTRFNLRPVRRAGPTLGLRVFGLVLFGWLFLASALSAKPRNVLLLISNNHSASDLGCYGHPYLRTPTLDGLAKRGTRFSHAFTTVASCGPARAVIYTGLLTHANGQFMHAHGYHNGVLGEGVRSVFDLAKAGGYRTALLGKTHLGSRGGQYEIDLRDETLWADTPGQAARAAQFIREGGDKPFVLVLATSEPESVARRQGGGDRPVPRVIDPAKVVVPSHLPDRPDVRLALAEYHELIERLDANYRAVLEMLEQSGKADSTLVMFFSDQGAGFPNGGYSQYEPGVRVPLIVVHPEAKKRGIVTDAMATLADITPTVVAWTGVKPPPYPLHGRSLLGVLEQEKTTGWDSVLLSHVMHEVTMYYPMRTLRERRYKLIWNLCHREPWRDAGDVIRSDVWLETLKRGDKLIGKRSIEKYLWRDAVELYDLKTDPDEVVNLANDPKHAELRRKLSERLLARLRQTGDNWLERFQLPMPGEAEIIGIMSPKGYAPTRAKR